MDFHAQIDIVAYGLTDRRDAGCRFSNLLFGGRNPGGEWVPLQGCVTLRHHRHGGSSEFVRCARTLEPAIRIDAHLVAARPAQQRVHRQPGVFAFDIPARLLQSTDGGVIDGSRAAVLTPVQELQIGFDVPWVLANQHRAKLFDSGGRSVLFPCQGRFAPPVETAIRGDFGKDPIPPLAVHYKGLNALDSHMSMALVSYGTCGRNPQGSW